MFEYPLQICWEITCRCNLRCIYCLNSSGSNQQPELEGDETIAVARDIATCRPLDVIISGGEPFLKPELKTSLALLKDAGARITVLSNGTALTKENAREYRPLIDVLQISLDAVDGDVQDRLTGVEGSYEDILLGIENALEAGFKLSIGAVVSKLNIDHIVNLVKFCIERKIPHVSLSAMMPQGRAQENYSLLEIDDGDRIAIIRKLKPLSKHISIGGHEPGIIFLLGNKSEYCCDCGAKSFAISADGWIMPCGYIRKKIASAREKMLLEIWRSDLKSIAGEVASGHPKGKCAGCDMLSHCKGGCKGLPYSYYGKVDGENPICVYNEVRLAL